MNIGMIGLGKMGGNMTTRLVAAGHSVVAHDLSETALRAAVANGAVAANDREHLVSLLKPVIIWLMIPSEFVDAELDALLEIVPENSIIIDGGNSDFRLSVGRASKCSAKNVHFIDVGTSGGILGAERGYAMMVGGDEVIVQNLQPLFDCLAPPNGWKHFGPNGSGHFVKMVHNAVEYGMMQSYSEGYRLLKEGPFPSINLAEVANVWQNGSIVESLLNELTRQALVENPELEGIDGVVAESGETRWAIETAKDRNITMPAIESSFQVRVDSQKGETNFATKLLAAMRNKFGGHAVNKE